MIGEQKPVQHLQQATQILVESAKVQGNYRRATPPELHKITLQKYSWVETKTSLLI